MIPIMTGPGLYLAPVSLTELSTAGRQSRKQSWQGLDEHVMAAPRRPEPWGLETEKGWRDTQVAAPCEVCRHHHHHHRHPDWGLWFVSRLWLTETSRKRQGRDSVSCRRDADEGFSSDVAVWMRRYFPKVKWKIPMKGWCWAYALGSDEKKLFEH